MKHTNNTTKFSVFADPPLSTPVAKDENASLLEGRNTVNKEFLMTPKTLSEAEKENYDFVHKKQVVHQKKHSSNIADKFILSDKSHIVTSAVTPPNQIIGNLMVTPTGNPKGKAVGNLMVHLGDLSVPKPKRRPPPSIINSNMPPPRPLFPRFQQLSKLGPKPKPHMVVPQTPLGIRNGGIIR